MIKNFEDFVHSETIETIEEGILSKLFKKDSLKNRDNEELDEYLKMFNEITKISQLIIEISNSIDSYLSGMSSDIFIMLGSDFIKIPFTTNNLRVSDIVEMEKKNEKEIKYYIRDVLKKTILSNDYNDGDKIVKAEKFRIGISFVSTDSNGKLKKMYRHIRNKSEEKNNPIFEIEKVEKIRCYTDTLHDEKKFEEGKGEIIWFNDFKKVKKFFE